MSRIAKMPILIPIGVKIQLDDQLILIENNGIKQINTIHKAVKIQLINNQLTFIARQNWPNGWALAGTMRSLINNTIIGITEGFIRKLQLIGIGYRAIVKDNTINLSLGFSHIINHKLPKEIIAECPSQVEIVLKSYNKQLIGQAAANLCAYRYPEPYKGKGIRYANAIIRSKEAKKK